MLSKNLVFLRNSFNYSQEFVAEKVNISRPAYSKWEKGETIPDIEKCNILAKLYNITLEQLFYSVNENDDKELKDINNYCGKHIFGNVTMDDNGQIFIPKEARKLFNFNVGDKILVLGDETYSGIALMKVEDFETRLYDSMKNK